MWDKTHEPFNRQQVTALPAGNDPWKMVIVEFKYGHDLLEARGKVEGVLRLGIQDKLNSEQIQLTAFVTTEHVHATAHVNIFLFLFFLLLFGCSRFSRSIPTSPSAPATSTPSAEGRELFLATLNQCVDVLGFQHGCIVPWREHMLLNLES